MIDVAVWCDFFASKSWPYEQVAKALAYLFKVPEGAAQGVDPGFFRQMETLTAQAQAAHDSKLAKNGASATKKRVRIRPEEKSTEWAIPHDARVICAGLACVDMQLNKATGGEGGEGIETFEGEKSIGGGRCVRIVSAVLVVFFRLTFCHVSVCQWHAKLLLVCVMGLRWIMVSCK
jgi:hypothetical protein